MTSDNENEDIPSSEGEIGLRTEAEAAKLISSYLNFYNTRPDKDAVAQLDDRICVIEEYLRAFPDLKLSKPDKTTLAKIQSLNDVLVNIQFHEQRLELIANGLNLSSAEEFITSLIPPKLPGYLQSVMMDALKKLSETLKTAKEKNTGSSDVRTTYQGGAAAVMTEQIQGQSETAAEKAVSVTSAGDIRDSQSFVPAQQSAVDTTREVFPANNNGMDGILMKQIPVFNPAEPKKYWAWRGNITKAYQRSGKSSTGFMALVNSKNVIVGDSNSQSVQNCITFEDLLKYMDTNHGNKIQALIDTLHKWNIKKTISADKASSFVKELLEDLERNQLINMHHVVTPRLFMIAATEKLPHGALKDKLQMAELYNDVDPISNEEFQALCISTLKEVQARLPNQGCGFAAAARKGEAEFGQSARVNVVQTNTPKCVVAGCNSNQHYWTRCQKLHNANMDKRKMLMRGRCWLCGEIHARDECTRTATCNKCKGNHHQVMCMKKTAKVNVVNVGEDEDDSPADHSASVAAVNVRGSKNVPTFSSLPVEEVVIAGESVKILFDTGASTNVISQDLAEKMKLQKCASRVSVDTMGNTSQFKSTWCYRVPVPTLDNKCRTILAIGIPGKLCRNVNSMPRDLVLTSFEKMKHSEYAAAATAVVASDVNLILCPAVQFLWPDVAEKTDNSVLYRSRLNDVYYGVGSSTDAANAHANFVRAEPDFYSVENLGLEAPRRCTACTHCKDCNWRNTFISDKDNLEFSRIVENLTFSEESKRWVSLYPKERDVEELRKLNNKNQVVVMTKKLEQRVLKAGHWSMYVDAFKSGIERGVYVPVTEKYDGPVFYISFTEAYKDSSTTPFRLCSNAALKFNGVSLNDYLSAPPNINNDVFDIFLKWRSFPYAFTLDIKKFYNQILSDPVDQHLRRVLFREDVNEDFAEFYTATVNFGDRPAGAVATAALRSTADKFGAQYPEAATKLKEDVYLDDILSGGNTEEHVKKLVGNMSEITSHAGFSFKPPVYSGEAGDSVTILGTMWTPESDTLSIRGDFNYSKKLKGLRAELPMVGWEPNDPRWPESIVRRELWRCLSQLFDLLGLVSPFSLNLKLTMRDAAEATKGWDEKVPSDVYFEAKKVAAQIPKCREIQFPRSVIKYHPGNKYQLIVFSDASSVAYAACVYLMTVAPDGSVDCNLLTAKTRCAPLGILSIPKLELLGAYLAVQLCVRVKRILRLEIANERFFTDSSAVLGMIKSKTGVLAVFNQHRVAAIRHNSKVDCWQHVPTAQNIADFATRRHVSATVLDSRMEWRKGPGFLYLPEEKWPAKSTFQTSSVPFDELSARAKHLAAQVNFVNFLPDAVPLDDLQDEFDDSTALPPPPDVPAPPPPQLKKKLTISSAPESGLHTVLMHGRSYHQAVQVTRRVLEAVKRFKMKKKPVAISAQRKKLISVFVRNFDAANQKPLKYDESVIPALSVTFYQAENALAWLTQKELQTHPQKLHKRLTAAVADLDCGVGDRELTVVTGRHGWLPDEKSYLPFLPTNSVLASKFLLSVHNEIHDGTNSSVARSRRRFWVPKATNKMRGMVYRCITCHQKRGAAKPQKLAAMDPDLKAALNRAPFSYTTGDVAGPYFVKTSQKNTKTTKVWVAVFTCRATGAMEAHMLTDLSAHALSTAFLRLITTRGIPQVVASDNATNFRKMAEILTTLPEEQRKALQKISFTTRFKFSSPRYPSSNGHAERMIGIFKDSLGTTAKTKLLTKSQFEKLTWIAAANANSRPLGVCSSASDRPLLTPAMLLTGRANVWSCQPDNVLPLDCLGRADIFYTHVHESVQTWWKLYRDNVWETFFPHQKNHKVLPKFKIGDPVLYDRLESRPGTWKFGIVTAFKPSADGLVHNVEIAHNAHAQQAGQQPPLIKKTIRNVNSIKKLPIFDNED